MTAPEKSPFKASLIARPRLYRKMRGGGEGLGAFIKRSLPPLLIGATISGIASIAWFAHMEQNYTVDYQSLPVIPAERTEHKSEPKDPGGRVIPHQDKLIYNVLTGKEDVSDPSAIQYLPDPEQPMLTRVEPEAEKPKPLDAGAIESQAKKELAKKVEEVAPVKQEAQQKPEVKIGLNSDVAKGIGTGGAQTGMSVTLSAKKPPRNFPNWSEADRNPKPTDDELDMKNGADLLTPSGEVPPEKPQAFSGYSMQLGSYKSRADLEAGWKSLQKKNPEVLSDMDYWVKEVQVGDRGTFHRLMAGPLRDPNIAREMCQKLSQKRQGCIVVRN